MNYPIIDWELGKKLAGNNAEMAEEMIDLLIQHLPKDLANIQKAYNEKQYDTLIQQVHRLHGALCYCGAPRLKNAIQQLESKLKQKHILDTPELSNLFIEFEKEAEQLLIAKESDSSY